MNERLKELYLQAHGTRHYDGDPALDGNPPTVYWQGEVSAQRFAELIVRECVEICINKNVSNLDLDIIRESGKFTLQDLATKSCGENLSKQIKEHFGVLE